MTLARTRLASTARMSGVGVERVEAVRRVTPKMPRVVAVKILVAASVHEHAVAAPVAGVEGAVEIVVVAVHITVRRIAAAVIAVAAGAGGQAKRRSGYQDQQE